MPARRLLIDLTAEDNQVYLFMVVFASILFGTPPLIKLYKYFRPDALSSRDSSAGLELWNFQDEFDDMRDVADPLEEENNRGRTGQNKKKKKKKKRKKKQEKGDKEAGGAK